MHLGSGHHGDLLGLEHEQVDELVLDEIALVEILLGKLLGDRQNVGELGAAPASHLLRGPQNIFGALSAKGLRGLVPQHNVRDVLLLGFVRNGHLLDDLGAGAAKKGV